MKKTIFILLGLSVLASSWGVYRYFNKYHRARNANAPRPELIVYTHSSFMNPFGPGPEIAKEFSKICLCNVRYVDGGGGHVVLQKLKLAESVDVVLGLDQISLKDAVLSAKWRELKPRNRQWLPVFENNKYKSFLAYDWAPVSFVFRQKKKLEEAKNLRAMLESIPDKSLSIQDPNFSNLGLQLVYWAFLESGRKMDKFGEIARLVQKKTKQISPDWSGAYGSFKRGASSFVLSYMTSPLYHLKVENDQSYGSTKVMDGHPIQIEFAGVPGRCRSCRLAERFVEFMTSNFAQRVLYEKNYMLPVVKGILQPEEEQLVPEVKAIGTVALDEFVDQREEILKRWNQTAN